MKKLLLLVIIFSNCCSIKASLKEEQEIMIRQKINALSHSKFVLQEAIEKIHIGENTDPFERIELRLTKDKLEAQLNSVEDRLKEAITDLSELQD